ncbi:MAG: branched-chain amino acid ABC transporter permease [Deltaproteobacteria bacterium]|nr:branched-chain amino acid ABC transporter permease [Deltaproteobacteria bacterium]
MEVMIQAILNGILMGGIYGATALGLTLIFGVLKIINFAHGSLLMVGMFLSYYLVTLTKMNPYLAILFIAPVLFFFGYYIQQFLVKPVFESEHDVREPIGVIILTTGLWFALENIAILFFGAEYKMAQTTVGSKSFIIGEYIINGPRLYAFIISFAMAGLLHVFLKYTWMGKAIRSVSLDRETAKLMGIKPYNIFNIAFGIGTMIAGISGAILIPFYYVFPTVGVPFDNRAFVIVVLGGLGSIPGAMLGGVIIGVIESVASQFIMTSWTEALIFVIFITLLFVKPAGLFGLKQDW